mgnify:CR=1 FL=1
MSHKFWRVVGKGALLLAGFVAAWLAMHALASAIVWGLWLVTAPYFWPAGPAHLVAPSYWTVFLGLLFGRTILLAVGAGVRVVKG